MKLAVEEIDATKKRLKVEIPTGDIEAALEKAYKDLNKSVKVDGFRPGKTPKAILEKHYKENVEAEVLERIVPEFYVRAVEESKMFPVANPTIEEKGLKLKKGEPLSFTATVEVRPEFALGEYKGIEVKDEPVEVTESELAEALDDLRDMHSTLETVTEDRPTKHDDYVVIDFEGFIDGAAIQGGKAENYPLQLGSSTLIAGFEEQIEGMKKGETREIKVKFPEDYKSRDLAGKDATFNITLKEIKAKVLPELDDEFAKDLGLGKTLDGLKKKVEADIMGFKKRALAAKQKEEILKHLAKSYSFELPPSLIQSEMRSQLVRRHQELLQSGKTLQDAGFDAKTFEADTKPLAEDRVKTTLVLSAIAEKEGIDVSDKELEDGIRMIAAEAGRSPKEVMELYQKREGGLDNLRSALAEDKVLEFLLAGSRKA